MRTVECAMEISVAPQKIISAFTDLEMLKGWWSVEKCFIELKPGGIYTLAWGISENSMRYISTGVIKKYEPGKILHIGDYMYLSEERPFYGPLNLIIEVSAVAHGSLLKLTQGPYPQNKGADWDWYYEVVKEAWPKVLLTMKQYLEK